jgi:hypothetical protein
VREGVPQSVRAAANGMAACVAATNGRWRMSVGEQPARLRLRRFVCAKRPARSDVRRAGRRSRRAATGGIASWCRMCRRDLIIGFA